MCFQGVRSDLECLHASSMNRFRLACKHYQYRYLQAEKRSAKRYFHDCNIGISGSLQSATARICASSKASRAQLAGGLGVLIRRTRGRTA